MVQKKRYKPFYKQFLRLRKNIQDRPKIFKFKKQKWQSFQRYAVKKLKFFTHFKVKDQFQLTASRFASRGNSFQKKFRNNLHNRKLFSLFYGGLKKKYVKKNIKKLTAKKLNGSHFTDFRHNILKFFESRLDIVLYRAKFCLSVKGASQLILHGHVLVNGSPVRTKSYNLKTNDFVEITSNVKARSLVKKNLDRSNFWPIPPKHLLINYRTLQILFVYTDSSNQIPVFNHFLNLESVVTNIRY